MRHGSFLLFRSVFLTPREPRTKVVFKTNILYLFEPKKGTQTMTAQMASETNPIELSLKELSVPEGI